MTTYEFNWLHISDLHLKEGQSYDRDVVLKAFLESLPSLLSRVPQPDLVFFSGDVANSGKQAEYKNATLFFDDLLDVLKLGREKLIVVPGNHDINRKMGKGLQRTLNPNDVDEYFDPSDEFLHIAKRQEGYKDWYNVYFDGIREFPVSSTIGDVVELNIGGTKVAVLPINSASFCFDNNDSGKLWIGRRCLDGAIQQLTSKKYDVKFGIVHHPLGWLDEAEQQHITNDLEENLDILLRGHLHQTDVKAVAGINGQLIHLAAGATYQTRKWPNKAMFGGYSKKQISVLPIIFSEDPKPKWTIDTSLFSNSENYWGTYNIGSHNEASNIVTQPNSSIEAISEKENEALALKKELEDTLFVSPNNIPLEAEARLVAQPHLDHQQYEDDDELHEVKLVELINSEKSYVIEARTEYGGTTLCKRLAVDFHNAGKLAIRRDAIKLPKYIKKLENEFSDLVTSNIKSTILILDNFNFETDKRLLSELVAADWFSRIIIVATNNGFEGTQVIDTSRLSIKFEHLFLWPLGRRSIREITAALFLSNDAEYVSTIVDKVYSDLLGLCIPLTPSNVIMYLKILNREGEFHPINRVDILDRYLSEILRTPADAYSDAFNAKNKLDVLSRFAYQLWVEEKNEFDTLYWSTFVTDYQKDTLTEFSGHDLLHALIKSRIILQIGDRHYFKYRFFFIFFVGRYIALRHLVLNQFLENEEYLSMPDLVDVITSLNPDCTPIFNALNNRLKEHIEEFFDTYINKEFDPLSKALWSNSDDEEEKVWAPIRKELESSAKTTDEIDVVKTSLQAERRSADQKIKYEKFSALEYALFSRRRMLADALRNSDNVSGDIKLAVLKNIFDAYLIAFQVGTYLSPLLGKYDMVAWGGIGFIGFRTTTNDLTHEIQIAKTIINLGDSVSRKAAEEVGTKKLGPLFRVLESEVKNVGLSELVLFYCILASKGGNWEKSLKSLIEKTDKNAYLLHVMVLSLVNHLKREILVGLDREKIQALVEVIRAKRVYNKQSPGKKAIKRLPENSAIKKISENE